MSKISYLRWFFFTGLLVAMCWIFLAPTPMPFGIAIQRELGFVGHVCVFAVVSLACSVIFNRPSGQIVLALLGCAVCLESAQAFIPTRGADILDFAMNCLGIVIGIVIFRIGRTWVTDPRRTISET